MTKDVLSDKLEDCLYFYDDGTLMYNTTIRNLKEFIQSNEKNLVKDFVEKIKENYSAHDKDLGVNVVFLTEKELDDCVKFFFEESK